MGASLLLNLESIFAVPVQYDSVALLFVAVTATSTTATATQPSGSDTYPSSPAKPDGKACEVDSGEIGNYSTSDLISLAFLLETGLADRYPEQFGGLWVDEAQESITVATVENGEDNSMMVLDRVTYSNLLADYSERFLRDAGIQESSVDELFGPCGFARLVESAEVRYSLAELEEAQDRVRETLRAGARSNRQAGISYLGIDIKSNALVAGLESGSASDSVARDNAQMKAALHSIPLSVERTVSSRVCFTGRASGSHCDTVSGVNMDFLDQVGTSTRIETRTYAGDSGAGVFGNHRAHGIMTGHSCGIFDCDGFYTPMNEVYDHLSSHITLAND
ncbi:hypothetical protein [Demequina sediminicola]|uniref:hypothetical protein n=1 Tax=Demequina sediminicola TaxID=1095026 RepID=UPI00128E53F3|nr:hypothetical protein [Demequina sediminicola]